MLASVQSEVEKLSATQARCVKQQTELDVASLQRIRETQPSMPVRAHTALLGDTMRNAQTGAEAEAELLDAADRDRCGELAAGARCSPHTNVYTSVLLCNELATTGACLPQTAVAAGYASTAALCRMGCSIEGESCRLCPAGAVPGCFKRTAALRHACAVS